LKQHGAAILKAPCGCEIISSLRYFGIQPKIAGWPGELTNQWWSFNKYPDYLSFKLARSVL